MTYATRPNCAANDVRRLRDQDDARRIRGLERTVGELRQRIRELEDLLMPEVQLPMQWGLNRRETQVFRALLAADVVPVGRLFFAIYADEDEEILPEVIFSHMSKVKAKLRPFGVTITNQRNVGYSLEARLSWRAKLG